jgi:hypothetical protein
MQDSPWTAPLFPASISLQGPSLSDSSIIPVTPILERIVFLLWCRIIGMPPSPLHRLGPGHVLNIAGMMVASGRPSTSQEP